MTRRLLAIGGALALALIGILLVVNYAADADRRALAELDPVQVLVAAETVPQGTSTDALGALVTVETLPATAVGPGALTSLNAVAGRVTDTVVVPGEQLLETRFVDPDTLIDPAVVPVPEGMHEVSVLLDGPRALGGKIRAGDTVGVAVSSNGDPSTRLSYHKVLITRVQGGLNPAPTPADEAPTETGDEVPVAAAPSADPLPGGSVMVSLALVPEHVEEVVYAAEYERIWLTREGADVPEGTTGRVTGDGFWGPDGALG